MSPPAHANMDWVLHPRGPFSLAASSRFLEGFAPAAHPGGNGELPGHLHMAFPVEGSWEAVAVCATQDPDGAIRVQAHGTADRDAVRRQVERILSLDVDGTGFVEVGRRDRVVGGLQARYPGLRPVCFWSPYEAAAWALISHRLRITQAAGIKARMAEGLGVAVGIHGQRLHAFPGPERLAGLEGFPGLTERKAGYLRQLAAATLEGRLDAARLRALPRDQALTELRALPGIGPFSSGLILLRGAGDPDAVPDQEPRLGRAVVRAYGLKATPSHGELREFAEGWRPYRTWVAFLLRVQLEAETGEIAGRRDSHTR
jgi:DNA-3-methyladenine glycosylase II